jgi:DNA-binding transcriptional LysR family regulator
MVLQYMEHFSVDLLDVLAFVRVVETGAFSRAAERMGMSKSIVSRRVARLEEQLGARLLTRSASGAQPTAAGQAYHERAANILCDLEAAKEVIARRIAASRRILVGSRGYLEARGMPEHPRDLAGHDHLVYGNEQWRFRVGNRWENVRLKPRLRADNGEMLRAAAATGLGLCVLPTFIASPALKDGTLMPLLRDFPMPEGGLHVLTPPGRAVTARVRALSDFLAGRFGPEPAWDPCWAAQGQR